MRSERCAAFRRHAISGGEKKMAKGKDQHVVKREDGWAVRGGGNKRDTSHHETQKEAINAARDIAKNNQSEVVIHGRDGRIRDKDSYGSDTNPPKDTKH